MAKPTRQRTTGQILGERVEHYRNRVAPTTAEQALRADGERTRPGLTQQELATRTADLGWPMNRVTIAKIERAGREPSRPVDRTRADNATLVDVLVLAAALDVSPPLLFIPLGEVEEVSFGSLVVHPHLLLDWVTGDSPLVPSPKRHAIRHEAWWGNNQTIVLFRRLREMQDRVHQAESRQAGVADLEADSPARLAAGRNFDRALMNLDRHIEQMRDARIKSIPEMPKPWVTRTAELHAIGFEDDE